MNASIGQPVSRVDGPAKVTGAARYAADFIPQNLAFAAVVQASVPKGRITSLDDGGAKAAPGVLGVISHLNAPRLPYQSMKQRPVVDPKSGEQLRVFQSDRVLFNGQPVAVVIAQTWEQAVGAAALVRATYATEEAVTSFRQAATQARTPGESKKGGKPADQARGGAEGAFAQAAVKVDATYLQPSEFHAAMELHATVAAWEDDRLTLWDKTQWPDNDAEEIAHVFGIKAEQIRVICPFVGGGFGSALRTWPHVTVAALAAKMVGRPVKLVLSRRQLFTSIGYRPFTEQRVRLGAGADGRLQSLIQEVIGQTSTYEEYAETVVDPPAMLYSTPNLRTGYRLAPMNVNTPCPMRAPGIVTGVLALEMAMDELAEATGVDPLQIRLINYADRDENKDLPWSSKSLKECYQRGAETFGWERRPAKPGTVKDGGWLVGYGMASAVYPTHRAPATARAIVYADGTAVVSSASSDMGPGTYTSMTQVAADALGLPVEMVRFELGDTALPKAPVHGGSITMASVGPAVEAACRALRAKARELGSDPNSPEGYAELLKAQGLEQLSADGEAKPGDETSRYSMYAFGAVFAEVRVDPVLGVVKVPRILGAYATGRLVNPKLAHSQCIGGLVGGLGMALTEQGVWDERLGKVMNSSLADYLVPVNADIGSVEAIFVEEHDPHVNPLGVKGVGEIAQVGVAPAIVNAVANATGRRIRQLPITPDKVML